MKLEAHGNRYMFFCVRGGWLQVIAGLSYFGGGGMGGLRIIGLEVQI